MPLFWFRIASQGSGPERYTLQVPFQLGPGDEVRSVDDNRVTFGSHDLEIVENQGVQLLRVLGFKTAAAAETFFPRLRGALLHLVVKKQLSVRSSSSMQEIRFQEPPIDVRGSANFGSMFEPRGWTHLDGHVDHSQVVVIPEHLRIMEFGAGSASATISMPASSFLGHLAASLALSQPQQIAADERLSLAIDLYAASLWEASLRAKVVNLATSLEVVVKPEKVGKVASDQIDQMLGTFDSAREPSAEDPEQRRALDRMRSRIAGLKDESISENLRKLAARHATSIGETIDDARRNMVSAYAVRSKLVHDGYATDNEISTAAAWLRKTVPAILEAIAIETSRELIN